MSNKYRPIYEIAEEIRRDWKKVNYAAVPYLEAMMQLEKITDKYIMDSAKSVILYFLSNAGSWRGETAKRIKAELKAMVNNKPVKITEQKIDEQAEYELNESTMDVKKAIRGIGIKDGDVIKGKFDTFKIESIKVKYIVQDNRTKKKTQKLASLENFKKELKQGQ